MAEVVHTDVTILGKGFAGLILSLILKRKGVPHVLLDRQDKRPAVALGETLPPSALGLLASLDLLEIFEAHALQKTYGYHSVWGAPRRVDNHFFHHNPYKYGLKLDRPRILAALQALVPGRVMAFEQLCEVRPGRLVVTRDGKQVRLNSKLLVDATGRKRALLKHLGVGAEARDDLIAFSCHQPRVKLASVVHGVLVEAFSAGWGIVSALDADTQVMSLYTRSGHAGASRLRDPAQWEAVLAGTHLLKQYWTKGDFRVRGGDANSSRAIRMTGADWLAVGDAAMAYDPLSSHGISNAIYGATRAGEAIVAHLAGAKGKLEAYEALLGRIFETYLGQQVQLYRQEKRWPDSAFWK